MSIVAVSNGAAVLESTLGPVIDSFDHIVRFNDAPLSAQLEPHAGTRTTIWACADCPHYLYATHAMRFAECRQLFVVPDLPRKDQVPSPSAAERIPPGFEMNLREQVRPSGGTWCTTGLISLAWLLQEFDTIHTVGWFKQEAASSYQGFLRHYDSESVTSETTSVARRSPFQKLAEAWHRVTTNANSSAKHGSDICHDVQAEAAYFRGWVESGRIIELDRA